MYPPRVRTAPTPCSLARGISDHLKTEVGSHPPCAESSTTTRETRRARHGGFFRARHDTAGRPKQSGCLHLNCHHYRTRGVSLFDETSSLCTPIPSPSLFHNPSYGRKPEVTIRPRGTIAAAAAAVVFLPRPTVSMLPLWPVPYICTYAGAGKLAPASRQPSVPTFCEEGCGGGGKRFEEPPLVGDARNVA